MHKTNNVKINKYFKELFTVPTTQMKLFSQRTYKDEKDKRVCIPNLSSIDIKEKKKKNKRTQFSKRMGTMCTIQKICFVFNKSGHVYFQRKKNNHKMLHERSGT